MIRFFLKDKRISVLLGVLAAVYAAMICLNFCAAACPFSRNLKYAGVALCFGVALASYRHASDPCDAKLLIWALLFTLAADALFLYASAPASGVVSFYCVHLLYIRRYKKKFFKRNFLMALAAAAFSAVGFLSGFFFPYILLLGAVYAVLLFTSVILAFKSSLPPVNKRLAGTGMILFLLCDFNVAVSFFARSGSLPFRIAGALEWIVYIPSQALLALSVLDYDPFFKNMGPR